MTNRSVTKQEESPLRIALRKLVAEVQGMLAIAKDAMREEAGNTNVQCLELRLRQAIEALSGDYFAPETTVTVVAWRYKDSRGHWRYTGSEPKPEHAILKAEPLYTLPSYREVELFDGESHIHRVTEETGRDPPPPEVLAGALQDVVHTDTGRVRAGRSVKASDDIGCLICGKLWRSQHTEKERDECEAAL